MQQAGSHRQDTDDFFSTEMIVLKHSGTTAWLSEKLKMSSSTSLSAHFLSSRPGLMSGLASFRGLTLDRVPDIYCTVLGQWELGWTFLLANFSVLGTWVEIVKCIWELDITIIDMWCSFLVCDGPNALPHTPCVLGVYEVAMDFFVHCCASTSLRLGQIGPRCVESCVVIRTKCSVLGFQ